MRDGEYISTYKSGETDSQHLIEDMVGRKIEVLYPKQAVEIGEEILRVEELCVRSGLPTASLLSTLMKLQLTGRVTCLPGKRYVLR